MKIFKKEFDGGVVMKKVNIILSLAILAAFQLPTVVMAESGINIQVIQQQQPPSIGQMVGGQRRSRLDSSLKSPEEEKQTPGPNDKGHGDSGGMGQGWSGQRLGNSLPPFVASQGIDADPRALRLGDFGIRVDDQANKTVEKVRESETKNKSVLAKHNELKLSLLGDLQNVRDCGSPEMKAFINRLTSESDAAVVFKASFEKLRGVYLDVNRCLRDSAEAKLRQKIAGILGQLNGCLTGEAIRKSISDGHVKAKANLQQDFERALLVKNFGVDGLLTPTASDPKILDSVTETKRDQFTISVRKPLEDAFAAFLDNEVRDYRHQCAKALTSSTEEDLTVKTLDGLLKELGKQKPGPDPDFSQLVKALDLKDEYQTDKPEKAPSVTIPDESLMGFTTKLSPVPSSSSHYQRTIASVLRVPISDEAKRSAVANQLYLQVQDAFNRGVRLSDKDIDRMRDNILAPLHYPEGEQAPKEYQYDSTSGKLKPVQGN